MKHPIPKILKTGVMTMLLAVMPVAAIAEEKAVVMLAKDGTSYEVTLNEDTRISLGQGDVTLSGAAGKEKTLPYGEIDRILIGTAASGVSDLIANGEIAVYPSVTEGPLTIAGAEAGTEISVYDINGSLVQKACAADAPLTLDLSGAQAGVMIVRIGNYPVKIIKK